MLEQKIEQWINDFEAKFDDIDDLEKRAYKPIKFIYNLRNNSTYLGIERLKTESGTEEIIYCYIPSEKPGFVQGLVLKRENGRIGTIISNGNISLEKFIQDHTHFDEPKESKIKKYAIPIFISAIIPATYIGLKKFFRKDKD